LVTKGNWGYKDRKIDSDERAQKLLQQFALEKSFLQCKIM